MDKEKFKKIYTQFIDGTALANRISIYKDIDSILVNRHYYGRDNEYVVSLDITLSNECKYSMEITSNL